MDAMTSSNLKTARFQSEFAAQWLELIGFAAHPGGVSFSPSLCHYHAILDPNSTDEARLQACRAMLACVRRRIPLEEFEGRAKYKAERPVDPYRKWWKTTRFGAELIVIALLLDLAILGFERGG